MRASDLYAVSRPRLLEAVLFTGKELMSMNDDEPNWRAYCEEDLWYELVGCILGSRVRFESAVRAANRLKAAGLLRLAPPAWKSPDFQERVQSCLGGRGHDAPRPRGASYPFPVLRASQISHAACGLYGTGSTLERLLSSAGCPHSARRMLAERVAGIGPKQASLFLRNVGYYDELAVLDSHVMTYMNRMGLVSRPPVAPQKIDEYESIERVFVSHAVELGLSVPSLDVAVWIVSRVAGEPEAR